MKKAISVVLIAFALFTIVNRPRDAATLVQAGAEGLAAAANALIDVLVRATQ
jgi:hypothetical protein